MRYWPQEFSWLNALSPTIILGVAVLDHGEAAKGHAILYFQIAGGLFNSSIVNSHPLLRRNLACISSQAGFSTEFTIHDISYSASLHKRFGSWNTFHLTGSNLGMKIYGDRDAAEPIKARERKKDRRFICNQTFPNQIGPCCVKSILTSDPQILYC
jgi:hypothetical protein